MSFLFHIKVWREEARGSLASGRMAPSSCVLWPECVGHACPAMATEPHLSSKGEESAEEAKDMPSSKLLN